MAAYVDGGEGLEVLTRYRFYYQHPITGEVETIDGWVADLDYKGSVRVLTHEGFETYEDEQRQKNKRRVVGASRYLDPAAIVKRKEL